MPNFQTQQFMTEASSVSRHSLSSTVVGQAHFAGTGPAGTMCSGCSYWQVPAKKKRAICEKYHEMTGVGSKIVPPSTPSCRYFEERQKAS